MAEILLFHHVQGLTPGVLALADRLRAAGHTVHTPDLFDGRTFDSIGDGVAFVEGDDAPEIGALADVAAAALPLDLVYAGISLGVMQAQRLAQTRPRAAGALLLSSCLPVEGEWAVGPWPIEVPVQVHGKDDDPFFAHEGDLEAAQRLVELTTAAGGQAELFTYPGAEHLFVDSSVEGYDEAATDLVLERALAFLERIG